MNKKSKLLMLTVLAATASSAHACGNPGGGDVLGLLLLFITPGFFFGLATAGLTRMSYGTSLAAMFAIVFFFALGMGAGSSNVDELAGTLIIAGIFNALTHAAGFKLAAGDRGAQTPAVE